jgi:hypothetical protein
MSGLPVTAAKLDTDTSYLAEWVNELAGAINHGQTDRVRIAAATIHQLAWRLTLDLDAEDLAPAVTHENGRPMRAADVLDRLTGGV